MADANLDKDVLKSIIRKFEEEDIVTENSSRHKEQAYHHHNTVFKLNKNNIKQEENIQLLFDAVITRRAQSLRTNDEDKRDDDSRPTYKDLSENFEPEEIKNASEAQEVINYLEEDLDQIGQKIANEFLRVYIHVFEAEDWIEDLDVPLDTHVLQALARTGALEREGYSYKDTERMANTNRRSGAKTRISYSDLQEAFKDASKHPGIIFDELWLENKEFLSSNNEALQRESCLYELTQ